MKIAFVVINYNRREGTSRAICEVAERLALSHDVHIFSSTAEDVDLGRVKWHRIPGIRYPHIVEFLTFVLPARFFIKPKVFDIVHAAGAVLPNAHVYGIQNIQPAKRRILKCLSNDKNVALLRRLTRQMYLAHTSSHEARCYEYRPGVSPPLFLAVSTGILKELREFYQIRNAPTQVIPNGADLNVFRPRTHTERMAWRTQVGLDPNDTVLVFSGGEWRRKGLDLVIRALGQIPDRKVKLLVLGRDGARVDFERLARECGVFDRIVFAGFRRDVNEGLAAADVFVFPSWYEAFSVATIEAAASGLPVVATRINGTEDFIQSGVTGEFIEHDPLHIASVLNSLLSAPRSVLHTMGQAGRRLVEMNYTWDHVAKMTEDAYMGILNDRLAQTARV